jgi:CTP synthase (UTP-ammonia lyase)
MALAAAIGKRPGEALMAMVRIAIVGDYDPDFVPHVKTDAALAQMQAVLARPVRGDWLPTATLEQYCAQALAGFDGLWISPGSPYRSMLGALNAIRFARERGVPVLGTCGGCQHMAIEFAHHVLGIEDATSAETDPYASELIITPLSCSLKGKAMTVLIAPASRIAAVYGSTQAIEEYYCNFGLNPAYQSRLHAAGLQVVGTDADGEARILALPRHPFFVATLFVPQLTSTAARPHPLIVAFVKAAAGTRAVVEG